MLLRGHRLLHDACTLIDLIPWFKLSDWEAHHIHVHICITMHINDYMIAPRYVKKNGGDMLHTGTNKHMYNLVVVWT